MPNRNPSLTTSLLLPSKTQSLLLSWASFLCPLPQTVDLMLLERNRRVEREACREEEPDGYKVAFFYGHPTVSSIYLCALLRHTCLACLHDPQRSSPSFWWRDSHEANDFFPDLKTPLSCGRGRFVYSSTTYLVRWVQRWIFSDKQVILMGVLRGFYLQLHIMLVEVFLA